MDLKQHFIQLSKYNHWANQLILNRIGKGSEKLQGVLEQLHHLVLGDVLWLKRFATHEMRLTCFSKIQKLPELSNIKPIEDIQDFLELRSEVDEVFTEFCSELLMEHLNSNLKYELNNGQAYEFPLKDLVQHLLNHQVHHRAQINTLLKSSDFGSLEMDLIFYLMVGDLKFTQT